MDPEIKVEFIISGELSPQEISNLLGICPSRIWIKGERILNSKLLRKQNGWCLTSTVEQSNIDLESHIKDLLIILTPKAGEIVEICSDYGLYSEFSCAIDIVNNTPILNLSPETLDKISMLKTAIDIDIVLFRKL